VRVEDRNEYDDDDDEGDRDDDRHRTTDDDHDHDDDDDIFWLLARATNVFFETSRGQPLLSCKKKGTETLHHISHHTLQHTSHQTPQPPRP
jgi:hypothetical protein